MQFSLGKVHLSLFSGGLIRMSPVNSGCRQGSRDDRGTHVCRRCPGAGGFGARRAARTAAGPAGPATAARAAPAAGGVQRPGRGVLRHLDRQCRADAADPGHLFRLGQGAHRALFLRQHPHRRHALRIPGPADADPQGPADRLCRGHRHGRQRALRFPGGVFPAGFRRPAAAALAAAAGAAVPGAVFGLARAALPLRERGGRRLPQLHVPAAADDPHDVHAAALGQEAPAGIHCHRPPFRRPALWFPG